MELSVVYSMLIGNWDKDIFNSENRISMKTASVERNTVVTNYGQINKAMNPTHISGVNRISERMSARMNAEIPKSLNQASFKSKIFKRSGWIFKMIILKEN